MITREQVADLQPGDVVTVTCAKWAIGTEVGGPLWKDPDGVLRCGPISIRYPEGDTAQNADWYVSIVSRVPRPLYVNHPRTESSAGDVVRDDNGTVWMLLWRENAPRWHHPGGGYMMSPPGPLTLLVDGTTGQVVR